jgi:Tfp pilus assembly protein PilF
VLDAMIALRRDHDATRAGRLLDLYLGAHPHGALREEALVLAIEAATARGDAASARRWASSYGDAYPNGRFKKFARETLDGL